MQSIVHKIRLLDIGHAQAFENWVLDTDYATCPELPSVRSFDVCRVSSAHDAPFHYIEVIKVSSNEAFKRDMDSASFARLVECFSTMAEVVEEVAGTQLGAGYRAPA